MRATTLTSVLILGAFAVAACQPLPEAAPSSDGSKPAAITNRIDIPPEVVRNLGITFARVERRQVARTLRVPGAFEILPEARRTYVAPLFGRVRLLVEQYQTVEPGTPLYRLESPEFVRMQTAIAEADANAARREADHATILAEIGALQAALESWPARVAALQEQVAASRRHAANLTAASELWAARIRQLEELDQQAGGRAAELAEARSRQADANSALSDEAVKQAGYELQLADQAAAQSQERSRLPILAATAEAAARDAESARASAILARREMALRLGLAESGLAGDGWKQHAVFEQPASKGGTVVLLPVTDGQSVEAGSSVLETVLLTAVRFRGRALQSDLGLLKRGQPASIVAPTGGSLAASEAISGQTWLAPEADAASRTLDVLVRLNGRADWARPGVTAEAEIVYDSTGEPALAIPVACVVQDGLDKIIFRRDPNDSKKVIRTPVELGISDGRWVVVEFGVGPDDQIVLNGVYELKLTGAGKPSGGGHFHADGTYHEGDH